MTPDLVNWPNLQVNKKARWVTCAAIVFAVLSVGACRFLHISSLADIEAYFGMATESHPVWRQFALRRFNAGDSAAELLRKFPPTRKDEFGRYGVYSFDANATGISWSAFTVVTRDGCLLSAQCGSCTWEYTFFDVPDSNLDADYEAYHREKTARREQEKLERLSRKQ